MWSQVWQAKFYKIKLKCFAFEVDAVTLIDPRSRTRLCLMSFIKCMMTRREILVLLIADVQVRKPALPPCLAWHSDLCLIRSLELS